MANRFFFLWLPETTLITGIIAGRHLLNTRMAAFRNGTMSLFNIQSCTI
ncbi:MAG TPA: hypothetical protein PLB07_07275 [Bacteroidales bacterium]|nr:hypothetical protein [Bacteroidales bacterium]MDI9533364.1 hypothetical protein [Bacteroidota bacterium]OPZ56960.1 MAG: hypothetical protein BWY89_00956 [Bacteroidetes bacterium ADurb.BinA012]MBK7732832.1 hypothetical protein [Bacteroidales bacterium]MBP7036847.1 hypothetical protein [Bacteroidales bacterium]